MPSSYADVAIQGVVLRSGSSSAVTSCYSGSAPPTLLFSSLLLYSSGLVQLLWCHKVVAGHRRGARARGVA